MASLDELISQIQGVLDQIDEAIAGVAGVESETQELQGQFQSLGAEDKVQHLAAVNSSVEQWRVQLMGAADSGKELIGQVEAVKTGT